MAETVSPGKQKQLESRMDQLGIDEKDISESFILGSGPGGQKINKTASCVRLRHRPTGIEVRCQSGRSRAMNRFIARRRLCDKIEEKLRGRESALQKEREKIRRQKRRRSRRQKQKMLEQKRMQGDKKKLRKRVDSDAD